MKIKYLILTLLLCISSTNILLAQAGGLTAGGMIMNEKGEPIVGATAVVKENPTNGSTSDLDGRFKLTNMKSGETLVVSYMGYEKQEILIKAGNERMRVVLKLATNEMDEVVVVGRGSQRKVSVVGAISSVEVKDLKVPATSVSNMLAGRVPGIISVTRSGEPGKDFSQFWIRGISTFGAGSGALILIDGVEGNLNDLDPEDIESFSILKDASSTAVYGVRGANGVVLVTTKKGKAGKLAISIKANTGLSYSPLMPKYVDANTYASLANEAAISRGMNPIFSDVDLALFKSGLDPDLHPNVNWRNVILKDYTWNQQYFMSASAGGQVARYYLSVGYMDKEAIFKQDNGYNKYPTNVNYKKYNFRANVDVNLTPTTIFTLGLENIIVTQNYPGFGDNSQSLWDAQANLTPVAVPVLFSNGASPAYGRNNDQISPYVLLNQTGYRKLYRNTNNLNLRINQNLKMITEGLSFSALADMYSNAELNSQRTKMPALYWCKSRNRIDGSLNLEKKSDIEAPVYSRSTSVNRKFYVEAHLDYERVFNKVHRVSGLFHYYMEDYIGSEFTTDLTAIPKRYNGYSGRLTYSWKDTYFIEGNMGYTGSEAFESGKKFGLFPAISLGWIPTQYQAVKNAIPFVNYLKFRGSYGVVGNDRLAGGDVRFPYLTLMGTGSGSGSWNSGDNITETQVGSTNLRWEKSIKTNFGIDAHLFNSRVDATIDFYKDVRSGIYQQRASIPEEMGLVTLPWANVGKMKSWGIDGHISYTQPFSKDLSVVIRANLTQSKNKIENYEQAIVRYPYQNVEGYQSGINRGLIALGLFKDKADVQNSPRQTYESTVLPGDIKYKDVNGDGVIDDYDVVPLKYSNVPQIQYGFATEFNWKNWNLSVLFEGISRVQYFSGGAGYYPFNGKEIGNVLDIVANQSNRWTSADISGNASTENPNAMFPRLSYGNNNNNNRNSTFWLNDGSYLRLKNVQLSYRMQPKFLQKVGMESATISLIGDNLHVWSNVKIIDPAQASSNGAVYPLQRVYTLQLNLKF
ncbi:MAG: TonB-dependent receptor [Bacteroidota bacterium]|nr:TonB-dependent receptor [Bacteroidota bacterium]